MRRVFARKDDGIHEPASIPLHNAAADFLAAAKGRRPELDEAQ
jgi:hypothetical protein